MPKQKIYLSFDIEADGDTPMLNNMLSFGIVAFNSSGQEIGTFQKNLYPLEGHRADEKCMKEFWNQIPEIWKFVNTDQVLARTAIRKLTDFLLSLIGNDNELVWIAYPSAYDWQWIKNYYEKFKPSYAPQIGYTAKCISTMFWSYCLQNHLDSKEKKELWKELTEALPHTHNPLDDAREQGRGFFNLCQRLNINL